MPDGVTNLNNLAKCQGPTQDLDAVLRTRQDTARGAAHGSAPVGVRGFDTGILSG